MSSFQELLNQRRQQVAAMEAIAPSMEVIQREMRSLEAVIDPIILRDVRDCLIEDIRFLGIQSGEGRVVDTQVSNEILPTAFSYGLNTPMEDGDDLNNKLSPDGESWLDTINTNNGKCSSFSSLQEVELENTNSSINFPETATEQEVTLEPTEIKPETIIETTTTETEEDSTATDHNIPETTATEATAITERITKEEEKPTKRKRRTQKQFDCIVNKLAEELPRVQSAEEFEALCPQLEEFTGDGKYTLPDDLLEEFNKAVEYWTNWEQQSDVVITVLSPVTTEESREIEETEEEAQETVTDEVQPEISIEQSFLNRLTSDLSDTGSGDLWEEIRQHYGNISAVPDSITEAFTAFNARLEEELEIEDELDTYPGEVAKDGDELEIYDGDVPEDEELTQATPAEETEIITEKTIEQKNQEWQEAIASANETDLAAWDVWITNQLNDRNPEILPATFQALQAAKAKFAPKVETKPVAKYTAEEVENLNRLWLDSAEKIASSETYTKQDVDYIWEAIRVSDIDRTSIALPLLNKLTFLQENVPESKAVKTAESAQEPKAVVVVTDIATQTETAKPIFNLFGNVKVTKSVTEVANDATGIETEQVTEEVARESITPNFVATVNPQPQPQLQPTATPETAKPAVNFNMVNFGGGGIKRSSSTVATELSDTEETEAAPKMFGGIRVTQNVRFMAYPAGSGTESIARDSREYIIPVGTLGLHPKTDSLFVVVTWEEALANNAAIKQTLDIESTKDNFTVIPVKFTEPTPQCYLPLPPEECCVIDAAEFERIRSIQQKWINDLSNGKSPFDDDEPPF